MIFFISIIPISHAINAPGILFAKEYTTIYTPYEGSLDEIYVHNGDMLKKGELIVKMHSKELELDIQLTQSKLKETLARKLKAQNSIADLKPIEFRVKLLQQKLKWYNQQKKALLIYAPIAGKWISPELHSLRKSFLTKRISLGAIVPQDAFKFIAVVSQEKAFDLFREEKLQGDVKLEGVAEKTIALKDIHVIPYEKHQLPSAALGWYGGGDIQVAQDDPSGKKSVEAFFEIRADVIETSTTPQLFHERTGRIQIVLPDIPLGVQVVKSIKQLMQKRYQI